MDTKMERRGGSGVILPFIQEICIIHLAYSIFEYE